jgi:hypothetical protein
VGQRSGRHSGCLFSLCDGVYACRIVMIRTSLPHHTTHHSRTPSQVKYGIKVTFGKADVKTALKAEIAQHQQKHQQHQHQQQKQKQLNLQHPNTPLEEDDGSINTLDASIHSPPTSPTNQTQITNNNNTSTAATESYQFDFTPPETTRPPPPTPPTRPYGNSGASFANFPGIGFSGADNTAKATGGLWLFGVAQRFVIQLNKYATILSSFSSFLFFSSLFPFLFSFLFLFFSCLFAFLTALHVRLSCE